jgi:hypothetical protein
MRKRTTSKDFLKGYDELWQNGPAVKFSNPDAWSLDSPKNSRQKS